MRDINDPEHPYTLEQLQVVREEHIQVDDASGHVTYDSNTHQSHAQCVTRIISQGGVYAHGAALQHGNTNWLVLAGKVDAGTARSIQGVFVLETLVSSNNCAQVDVRITEGGHSSEASVNKQLADKERVAAALENPNLLGMVQNCLGL